MAETRNTGLRDLTGLVHDGPVRRSRTCPKNPDTIPAEVRHGGTP
jgi:hypothetical protein